MLLFLLLSKPFPVPSEVFAEMSLLAFYHAQPCLVVISTTSSRTFLELSTESDLPSRKDYGDKLPMMRLITY